jgi:hypothetical protein
MRRPSCLVLGEFGSFERRNLFEHLWMELSNPSTLPAWAAPTVHSKSGLVVLTAQYSDKSELMMRDARVRASLCGEWSSQKAYRMDWIPRRRIGPISFGCCSEPLKQVNNALSQSTLLAVQSRTFAVAELVLHQRRQG